MILLEVNSAYTRASVLLFTCTPYFSPLRSHR